MKRSLFCGDDLVSVSLPETARVLRPPEPTPPLADYESAVREALYNPLGCPPLLSQIHANSRVTIAFDDPCLPLPPMARDVRGRTIGVVLGELFKAGIPRERIRLVCAIGLHRKWRPHELRHLLGERVWSEMGSSRIQNHDAEDPSAVVELGTTKAGRVVEVNRVVKQSDVLVYVNVNWTSMNGGWKSILVGLGTFRSIRQHHNSAVLEQGSIMDPGRSAYHAIMAEMGEVVSRTANVFTIETVINNRLWSPWAERLLFSRRRLEADKPPLPFRASARLPYAAKRLLTSRLRSAYQPTAVHAGRVENVHPVTLEILGQQQSVRVAGQTDALLVGVPDMSPYASFCRINPVLVMNMALGYLYNFYQGVPLVRRGGVMIVLNPFVPAFDDRHHASYREFYERVLPETIKPKEIEELFEMDFARRPFYLHRYRYGYSYHGVHPLYAWSWGARALEDLSRVIAVGALDPRVPERMGFEHAASLEQALAMAAETVGGGFTLTCPLMPPIFCPVVTAV